MYTPCFTNTFFATFHFPFPGLPFITDTKLLLYINTHSCNTNHTSDITLQYSDRLWGTPSLLSNGYRGLFLRK